MLVELLINMLDMIIRDHSPTVRRRHCDHEREQGKARSMKDYFVENPTYDEVTF
ncbi:hypothetical protein Hanom_Chr07g00607901 [Helianthus anomalus]